MTDEEKPTEPIEPDEEPTASYPHHAVVTSAGGMTYPVASMKPVSYAAGGIVGSSITTTRVTGGMVTSAPSSRKKIADAPAKKPRKILVAFLDEDDKQLWAEKLDPGNITVDYPMTGAPKMTLELDLWVDEDPI